MKRVRFQTPIKGLVQRMDEFECHSPRPFIEYPPPRNPFQLYERVLPYSNNPIERYENSNSSPYPLANKTTIPSIPDIGSNWTPSNDLNLSMLDSSSHEPRKPDAYKQVFPKHPEETRISNIREMTSPQVLASVENNKLAAPPNVLSKDNSFFIRRDNIDKYLLDKNPLENQIGRLNLGKENDPLARKAEIIGFKPLSPEQISLPQPLPANKEENLCRCHHCVKVLQNTACYNLPQHTGLETPYKHVGSGLKRQAYQCHCVPSPRGCFHCNHNHQFLQSCHCNVAVTDVPSNAINAVDKKTWAIEKYEQNKKSECLDVEKQTNIVKEKREPTVADLFKIIKLQNEQLQLLQEKVDKFISASNNAARNTQPSVQNYVTEHVALQTIDSGLSEQHKISIGVMTSFEMVRTSTVINQEYVKQTKENAQIQCNRSQISIKEIVSKSPPVNLNFLDGIMPVDKCVPHDTGTTTQDYKKNGTLQQYDNINDDKTMNELSLCNVQVDNATTPLISPEQSLYLDVRDYSDSDTDSDQSNVGWTYYNKVMTHVNGMLQDSDMPSSASALCRNTRQQCVQMQIDKSNLSVTKRVKFGDDPLGIHQPHIYASSTDTSIKMNQLAAKYLKAVPSAVAPQPVARATAKPDMSFATRNYMERHKLLQGTKVSRSPLPGTKVSRSPLPGEIPRFLDITALKQQPKFL